MPTRRLRAIDRERRRDPKLPAILQVGTDGRAQLAAEDFGIWRTETPAETVRSLRDLRSHRIFSMTDLRRVLRWVGPEVFTATMLGRVPLKLDLDDGPSILGTRRLFDESSIEEMLLTALVVDGFCRAHGVALGSLGWTSEQFLRLSLPGDVLLSNPIGRKGYAGGRKACPAPGAYSDMLYVDLRAAYPSAMIGEPFAKRLDLDPKMDLRWPVGVALASVRVPNQWEEWPPLAEIRSYGQVWRTGEIRGWWPLRELRAAQDLGVEITPEVVLRGVDEFSPFDRWWSTIGPGRDLPGDAGRWMKAISNALHGTFVLDRPVKIVRFPEGTLRSPEVVRTRRPPSLGAAHLGTEICSRVRVRVLRELVPSSPVYMDTDGGIIQSGAAIPAPSGDRVGEWSVRERIESLDLRGTQAYAFRRWGEEREEVVLAGTPRASRTDLDRYAGDLMADTKAGWRRKIKPIEEPWVFDERGNPIRLSWSFVESVGVPADWTVKDPQLLGVEPSLPIPF